MTPRYTACKSLRLCDEIDPGLLLCAPDLHTLDEYYALRDRLLRGNNELEQLELKPLPTTAGEFFADLKAVHFTLFQHALPGIAGRFRNAGEPMQFGGSGRHGRKGARHDQIEKGLEGVFNWSKCRNDGWTYETRCTAFLTSFFRVHPFVDGNGRLGRFYVRRMCRAEGRVIPKWDESEPSRRAYIRALEHAHASVLERKEPIERSVELLIEWLRPQVFVLAEPDENDVLA